jgi:uncharacterized protein YcbK (DUF882 family)
MGTRTAAAGTLRQPHTGSRDQGLKTPIWAACIVLCAIACVSGTTRIGAYAASERTISFYNIHTKETLTSTYKRNGQYVPEEMKKINWILRDWRKDEATTMDPGLIDLVWEIHQELGSREPVHIISGYRSRGTNNMLRKTVGGQAKESRHILGKAMDVEFPDVPLRKLRYSALIRERGGVGYYPTSAIPFVHVDVDRVRAWPRLPRPELALLFPSGHTQHMPAEGGPITKADVIAARANHKELAMQIAQFQYERTHHGARTQVAALTPAPQLVALPQPALRPTWSGTNPSEADRARLAALAAGPPQLVAGPTLIDRRRLASAQANAAVDPIGALLAATRLAKASLTSEETFAPAPAYDDEHPEELSYRPFPIAPLLTATASADDPALARMVHPDLARTLDLLDQEVIAPSMRLRPGSQVAQMLWAQEFKGEAINLSSLMDPAGTEVAGVFRDRKVQTSRP